MNKFKKGFTLIELLVVVAIIGILSSVVLASLNSARAKGADAAIKADLSGIRATAEIYYDTGSTYAGTAMSESTCKNNLTGNLFADTSIINALTHANAQSGGTVVSTNTLSNTSCAASATSWAAAVTYKSDSAKSWCVDSLGTSKEENTAATAAATIQGSGTVADPYKCN